MPKPARMKKEESQPIYKVKFDGEVMVPMRDGVRLAVDVYRPDAKGKFPALLALGPWSKEVSSDLQWTLPPQVETSTRWDGSIEAGSSQYLVSRGYAHIIAQQRGIGHSEGVMDKDCEMDGYDLVEWIAQQPWCDGNVGMVGISAFAMAQLATAITQPPHLKAIFPYDTPGDMYRDAIYPGGILDTFIFGVSSSRLAAHTVDPARMAERQRLAKEVKSNPDNPDIYPVRDILMYSLIYNVLCHPQVSSGSWGLFDYIVHPYDGPFYQAISFNSRYSAIKVPAYLGSGWYAYTYMHLPGAFRNYAGLNVPKKLMIGPGATIEKPLMVSSDPSLNRPFAGYADEVVRWYDYWLKGIDTGIMNEPPIKIFTMENCDPVCGTWRFENEWPLARTKWTKFYLRTFERLSTEPPAFTDTTPDSFVQQPLTISNKIGSCRYQTRSLHEDLIITGPIALKLYASIDTDDDNWIVALRDVAPDGKRFELTRGLLKCSHRALDESKSKPWQPYHLHTKEAVEKIQPGKIYDYDIEIRPTSNKFKAGHRIELEIMSVDSPPPRAVEHLSSYHICANHICHHKIYRDPKHPSHLLLPVIPQE